MKKARLFALNHIAIATLALSNSVFACGGNYYVSPTGNDSNNGTSIATAFRTVQKCASVVQAGQTCAIESGFYNETVTPVNSGTSTKPITFTGDCGATPVISGADQLTSVVWTKVNGNLYSTSIVLNPSNDKTQLTSNQLFSLDLSKRVMVPTAFQEARWPFTPYTTNPLVYPRSVMTAVNLVSNVGKVWTWTITDPNLSFPANSLVGGVINFTGARAYNTMTGVITANDPVANTLTFTLTFAPIDSSNSPVVGSTYNISGPIALQNNSNGTFAYDAINHILYAQMPNGDSPSNYTLAVKQRDLAFNLSNLSYVQVRGLQIFAGRIITNAQSSGIEIYEIYGNYLNHYGYLTSENLSKATGGITLYGSNHELARSTLDMAAGTLVTLSGTNHYISNNLLTNSNYSGFADAALAITLVSNTQILNNTISGTGVYGILDKGSGNKTVTPGSNANNIFQYNDVNQYGYLARDLGGIYACCSNSGDFSGSVLKYNWFHDSVDSFINSIDQTLPYSQKGIYFDNGTNNWLVHHNIVWNVDTGILFNPSEDNVTASTSNQFYNNTIWDVTRNSAQSGTPAKGQVISGTFTNNIFSVMPKAVGAVPTPTFTPNNFLPPANPMFVSAVAPFNFNLLQGSPAIDTAQIISGITNGYVGSAPDYGANEYGAASWTPGCTLPGCAAASFARNTSHLKAGKHSLNVQ